MLGTPPGLQVGYDGDTAKRKQHVLSGIESGYMKPIPS
jgi:hypothetical protein